VLTSDTVATLSPLVCGFVEGRQLDAAHKCLKVVRRFVITELRQQCHRRGCCLRRRRDGGGYNETSKAEKLAETKGASPGQDEHKPEALQQTQQQRQEELQLKICQSLTTTASMPDGEAPCHAVTSDLALYRALVRTAQLSVAAVTGPGRFLLDVELKESDIHENYHSR